MGVDAKDSKPKLSRRDFLKIAGGLGALAVFKGITDLYKVMFKDMTMLIRCLGADDIEKKNLYEKELKPSYDNVFLVVHPGYGLLRFPKKYENNQEYLDYLANLKNEIEKERENGSLIVFLVGSEDVREGRYVSGLGYSNADLAVATNSANSVPITCIETSDRKYLYQPISTEGLTPLFESKKVKRVKIGGEFSNLCVAMAKNMIGSGDYEVVMSEGAVYPPMKNE